MMSLLRGFLVLIAVLLGLLLAIPVVAVGLPFWMVGLLTKALARLIEPRFVSWSDLIEYAPTVGWKPKPNLNTYYLTSVADDIFHIITDSQGWPGKISLAESQVVVFGDSFAFGYGVHSGVSFAEVDPRLRIKPIGCPGYNMVQELLLMYQLSSQLAGKLVVWFICLDNDLIDNLMPDMFNHRAPFVRKVDGPGEWEIVTDHVRPARWDYSARGRPYYEILAKLCSSSFLSERAYSACEFLINAGQGICQQSGARLVVMTIPNAHQLSPRGQEFLISCGADATSFDPSFPDRRIGEVCAKYGIPFVAGKNYLHVSDYKPLDPHWNERGHQRVAEVLRNLYQTYVPQRHRVGKMRGSTDPHSSGLELTPMRYQRYEA
jgi:hypothetical protein